MTCDLHLDTLWKMTKYGGFQIAKGAVYSDVNTTNLAKGQLDYAVFALYLAHHLECDAERLVGEQIANFQAQKWPQGFKGYLAMEGGQLLEGKLENLDKYVKAGIAYLTLTHNYNNDLGDSATDKEERGLTNFGADVVNHCHKVGVLVDVSHASDRTARMAGCYGRIIASHSGCRALLNHPRNITDELIQQIALTGGLVGVPFVKKFIGTHSAIADHIDHIAQLVGIRHVAIGSDIDGAVMVDGQSMDNWLSFADDLVKRGYKSEDIDLIAGGNFMRLLKEGR